MDKIKRKKLQEQIEKQREEARKIRHERRMKEADERGKRLKEEKLKRIEDMKVAYANAPARREQRLAEYIRRTKEKEAEQIEEYRKKLKLSKDDVITYDSETKKFKVVQKMTEVKSEEAKV